MHVLMTNGKGSTPPLLPTTLAGLWVERSGFGIFPKRDFSTFSFTIISQQRNKVPEKVSKEVTDIATIQASYLMTVESVILNDETHIRVHRRFVAND